MNRFWWAYPAVLGGPGRMSWFKKALLFLQKKKQKNSYLLRVVALAMQLPRVDESFLLLFFKKETLAFVSAVLPLCVSAAPALAQSAIITVSDAGGVPISPLLYGVNYVWDKVPAEEFPAFWGAMQSVAHAGLARYLGGWGAESYDWSANLETGKLGGTEPGLGPDNFIASVPAASFITPSASAVADPAEIPQTAALTAQLVARYGGRVRYWEVGNEWWLQKGARRHADRRDANLQGYAALLAAVVPAMKAANPSIVIFATLDWRAPEDAAALRQMVGPAWAQIDGISVHTYCGTTDPQRLCASLPAAMAAIRVASGKSMIYASEWSASKRMNPDDFGIRNATLTIETLQDMAFAGINLAAYWPPVKVLPDLAFTSADFGQPFATGIAFGWMSRYYEGTALRTGGDMPAVAARDGSAVTVIVPSGDAGTQSVTLRLGGLGLHGVAQAQILYVAAPDDANGTGGRDAYVAPLPTQVSGGPDNLTVSFIVNPGGPGRGGDFEIARVTLQ